MVESMQDAFRENLDLIQWMSPESRDSAKAKLEHMVDLIGYPAFVLNDTWLNQAFEDLDIKVKFGLQSLVGSNTNKVNFVPTKIKRIESAKPAKNAKSYNS